MLKTSLSRRYLPFRSLKRNLHCFLRIAAQAKAELIFSGVQPPDFEVPADCQILAFDIYAPIIRRFKVPLE